MSACWGGMSGNSPKYPQPEISQTLSGKLGNESPAEKSETLSRKFDLSELAQVFSLPWSAYVRLLSVKDDHARQFYEAEALHGGWSVRQLDRQIGSQFYERTALSKDKVAMLVKGSVGQGAALTQPIARGDAMRNTIVDTSTAPAEIAPTLVYLSEYK